MRCPETAVITQHGQEIAGRVVGFLLRPDVDIPHRPLKGSACLQVRDATKTWDMRRILHARVGHRSRWLGYRTSSFLVPAVNIATKRIDGCEHLVAQFFEPGQICVLRVEFEKDWITLPGCRPSGQHASAMASTSPVAGSGTSQSTAGSAQPSSVSSVMSAITRSVRASKSSTSWTTTVRRSTGCAGAGMFPARNWPRNALAASASSVRRAARKSL